MPLCNRETLVYDLRNVPGTFAQIIELPNLFKGVNLIDIRTKYFGNFRRFEVSRVNLSHGSQIGSSRSISLGSSYRKFREIEGSRNRE